MLVTVALTAVVVGIVAAQFVLRTVLLAAAQRATGLHIDARRIERHDGAYIVTDLAASTPGGAVVLDAPHARVTRSGANVAIVLDRPHVVVDTAQLRGDERLEWEGANATVHIHDGSLAITTGRVPTPALRFDGIVGSAGVRAGHRSYDFTLQLIAAHERYPVAARTAVRADGTTDEAWSAPAVPVAAFLPFFDVGAPFQPRDGWLRDIAIAIRPALHATARLDALDAAVDTHVLRGVHGTLVADARGIGSRDLAGVLDHGLPFDAAGEVRDAGAPLRWVRAGSNDLNALGRLLAAVANEPRLTSVRLEATAPGLAFAQYGMTGDHGPLALSVLSVDPRETTLRFDTAIAEDHVISGGERTSALAVRTGAVGGVNGDYFDIGRTYQPQGMLVRGGELVRGPTDRAALIIDKAKRVTFAEFHLHGVVRTAEGVMPVTEFNDWPPGDVAVITPAFGKQLPAAPDHTFVALESIDAKRYRVTGVEKLDTPLPARFGIAIGPLVHVPLPHPGETLTLDYALEPHVDDAIAGIGGGPILLRDGQAYEDPHAPAPDERNYRWPVIALARQNDDRLLFVAVDGRHPERSVGMTRPEFTELLQRLGGIDAMALDSGGSVTLVSRAPGDRNASVRNVPSDNSAERWVSDALFIYSSAPIPTLVPPASAPTPVPEARPTP